MGVDFVLLTLFSVAVIWSVWWPHREREVPLAPTITLKDLSDFRGRPGRENDLLLSVWGRIFNVSTGEEFYSPGQTYHDFAGHDCTHAFAISQKRKKFLNKDLKTLKEKQILHLNMTYWETYIYKYPIVARLADPPYDPTLYDKFAGPYAEVRPTKPHYQKSSQPTSKCPVTNAVRKAAKVIGSILPRFFLPSPEADSGNSADL